VSVEEPHLHLELGHILFLDIVGYSKLLIDEHTPITPALLRLDPICDPLRADSAFQKLCEEKQP
jgi:hypothetical protein